MPHNLHATPLPPPPPPPPLPKALSLTSAPKQAFLDTFLLSTISHRDGLTSVFAIIVPARLSKDFWSLTRIKAVLVHPRKIPVPPRCLPVKGPERGSARGNGIASILPIGEVVAAAWHKRETPALGVAYTADDIEARPKRNLEAPGRK